MGRYVFKLPDVGEGTAEVEIVAWHVNVGDHIEEDQNIADVMTDKATVEMTSPVTGTILVRHGEPGEMASVGAPLVEIDTAEGDTAAGSATQEAAIIAQDARGTVTAMPPAVAPPPTIAASGPTSRSTESLRPLAAPAVRQRAYELGIPLQFVPGSGPAGRIRQADLDAYAAAPDPRPAQHANLPASDEPEPIKLIGLRRKIAEKMQLAKQRIPHFAYVEEIDVTELEALRTHLNATRQAGQPKLTLLAFLLQALVRTLPDYPHINARFDDDAGILHRYAAVHAGIATETAQGLVVPVVRHAEALDLWQGAAAVARLAAAARESKATREDLSGGTITITSLGPRGGIATTPVINYPEVAILGPNAVLERPVVRDGQIAVRKMMNLSSSFDHRVVDGASAADFIQRLKARLEHPATLFMP